MAGNQLPTQSFSHPLFDRTEELNKMARFVVKIKVNRSLYRSLPWA